MPLLTTPEVAAEARVSEATLRYWRQLGTGPEWFKIGRRVVYDRADVDRWLAKARATTPSQVVTR